MVVPTSGWPPQSTRVSPTHGVDGHTSLKAHSARAWSRSKRRGLPQVSPTRALPRSSRRGQLEGRHDIVTPHSFKAGSRWAVTRAACRDTEGGCARDSLAPFVLGTSTRSFDEASSGQGRRRLPSSAPVLVPGLSRLGYKDEVEAVPQSRRASCASALHAGGFFARHVVKSQAQVQDSRRKGGGEAKQAVPSFFFLFFFPPTHSKQQIPSPLVGGELRCSGSRPEGVQVKASGQRQPS